MQHEQLITNARWAILKALAESPGSATELAEAAKTSVPNASQQLKLLEAYGLARPKKEQRSSPGKPSTRYTLGKEFVHIALVRSGFAAKRTLPLDDTKEVILNLWFLDRQDDQECLMRLYWEERELVQNALGIALVEAKEHEIHLLVLVEEKLLDEFRKRYSKMAVTSREGKERHVIAWTHTLAELRGGLERHEEYYTNLVRRMHVLVERDEIFAGLK